MSCIRVYTQGSSPMSVATDLPKGFSVAIGGQQTADVSVRPIEKEVKVSAQGMSMARLTFGLMCGSDIGAAILCGSDGILITIDGKYLIVRR